MQYVHYLQRMSDVMKESVKKMQYVHYLQRMSDGMK